MKMNTNRIELTFTEEQGAAIEGAVADLEAALTFVEAATPKERRELVKLGPKSREFAELAVTVARDHPSLLPAFGGHGMYGLRVHEAVLAAGGSVE